MRSSSVSFYFFYPSKASRLINAFPGAFQLYDIDGDGFISHDEMLQIVKSIYRMTGQMVKLPTDEDTPEKVHIFVLPPP